MVIFLTKLLLLRSVILEVEKYYFLSITTKKNNTQVILCKKWIKI